MAWELKDYREVPERIAEWYQRFPNGRIVCEVIEFTDSRVTVKASVYRDGMTDSTPAGVGHSFLAIPGSTPYTKGSELENAETSAAGRALVMAGIPAKAVASTQEVNSKRSADLEPGARPISVTSSEGVGMGDADGSEADLNTGAASSDPTLGEGAAKGTGEGSNAVPSSKTPEEEQADAYIEVLRAGPGNTQAVLQARALFESDARKIKNLRALSLDELSQVVQAFKPKVDA